MKTDVEGGWMEKPAQTGCGRGKYTEVEVVGGGNLNQIRLQINLNLQVDCLGSHG